MSLKHLTSGDPGSFAEWKRMWNDEVLPYLYSAQLVAGPGVRIDRRPAGTLIRAVPSDGAGNGGGVKLAAVVTMPTSGGGIGTVAPVMIGSGGEIAITSGAAIPAKFPFLDGYN